jgi:FtsH-binding integral membrane protein
MTGLLELWLPILLSAVLVFVVSSFIHMVLLSWHRNDCRKVPQEDKLMDSLRPLAIPPGDYMVPRPSSMQDLRTPEFAEKIRQGPVLVMTVLPSGPMSMGRNLVLWFLYSVVVGVFAAYVAGRALPAGAPFSRVCQLTAVTAFVGYSLALWQMSIWYRRAWSTTIKATVDGLIYALVTGATFAWLWPH